MIDDLLMCLRGRTVAPSEADELIAAIRDRTVWPRTWKAKGRKVVRI